MDERTAYFLPRTPRARPRPWKQLLRPPPRRRSTSGKRPSVSERGREGGREVERALYLADYARLPSCLDI